MKFNPHIQIELFGNSVAKLIDYKKLLCPDIGKGTNISNLKTTTITFYTPENESLTVLLSQDDEPYSIVIIDDIRIIIERIF